jgi:hypothetical protein
MTTRQQEEAIELLSRIAQEHRLTQGTMTRITDLLADIHREQRTYSPELPGGFPHMHAASGCEFAYCRLERSAAK